MSLTEEEDVKPLISRVELYIEELDKIVNEST